jgi:hypothetical protein
MPSLASISRGRGAQVDISRDADVVAARLLGEAEVQREAIELPPD